MAQKKNIKTNSKTTVDTRKWVIRGLIGVSVLLNVVFFGFVFAVANTGIFDYTMANMSISRLFEEPGGCTKHIEDKQFSKDYGVGARYCLQTTVQSPTGEILFPDYLKGQKAPQ